MMDAQQIQQAMQALNAGQAPEARLLLEKSVGHNPLESQAWALLARTYWLLKEPAKAAAAAKRAESAGTAKTPPETLHTLALYYAQSGDRKRAANLEGLYALSPKADPAAHSRAALLHYEVGDLDAAIRFGEMTEKSDPRPEVLLMLARAFEAKKQNEAALVRYRKLAELRPFDEPTLSQAGQAMLRAQSFSEAVPFLEKACAKFDGSPQLQLALGVAYYGQRRFLDAGRAFLRTLDLDPAIEQPYSFLARMIDQLEPLWPEISKRFTAWNTRDPLNHVPPFVLARLKIASQEEATEAENLLRESIRRKPDFWESHFELGGLLERRRAWAEAARELEESARLSPSQAEVQYRLSRVYARLNQPEKAAQARARHQKLTQGTTNSSGMAQAAK